MATLLQFSRNIRKRGSEIENASVKQQVYVARRVLRSVAESTPVDKGVARSNWRVSSGARTFKVIPAYAPGKKLGIGETRNLRAVISAGNAALAAHRANQALYITNNTPYIKKINERNTQGSTRFIERAAAAARGALREFRLIRR